MQNYTCQDFMNKAALLIPNTELRRKVVPIIIGIAVANSIPVSIGEDMEAVTVFNSVHLAPVASLISRINEQCIIDLPTAIDTARSMYAVRSRIANGQYLSSTPTPELHFMDSVLGIGSVFPLDAYNALKEVGIGASTLAYNATCVVNAMNK